MKLLNNVQKLRWERGYTFEDLEKLCGVSKSEIYKIENGHVIPNQITIVKICRGFELDADEVFDLNWRSNNM